MPEERPAPPMWAKIVGALILVALMALAVLLIAAVGGVLARGVRWGLEGW